MSLQYLNQQGLEGIGRFYSKYRGIVLDNEDPENLGRIKVVVPSVSNESVEWAYPSSIQGSPNSGMKYITPSLGQTVWVEFENGDLLYPVWSYYGWGDKECPEELKDVDTCGIVTPSGHKVYLKDNEGELIIIIANTKGEEVSQFSIKQGEISLKGIHINLQGGGQGIVLTNKLVEKLNTLEKQLNNLKQTITQAASAVVPQDGGKAAFSVLSGWSSSKITETKMEDIENTQILQNES